MKYLALLLLLVSSNAALACTPGAGNGPAGDPECMADILANYPAYGGGGHGGVRSSYSRASSWGALAFNPSTDDLGISGRHTSKRRAIKEALERCGSKECFITDTYKNGFGVISVGTHPVTKRNIPILGVASSSELARQRSIARCELEGLIHCNLFMIHENFFLY